MSLLLDALKRAEEAKRAKLAVERVAASAVEPSSLPTTTSPPASSDTARSAQIIPNAATELQLADYEDIGAQVAPMPERQSEVQARLGGVTRELGLTPVDTPVIDATEPLISRVAQASKKGNADRDVAKSVFIAKQSAQREEGAGKKWLLPAIAIGVAVVGAGGWYVWNEISRISKPASVAARPLQTPTVQPQPSSSVQPATAQANVAMPITPPAPVEAALPPLLPPSTEQVALPPSLSTAKSGKSSPTQLDDREQLAKALKEIPSPREEPVSLKLARSLAPPTVPNELLEAYQSLKDANYPLAITRYSRIVQAEPLNLDAQIGLATAFARAGDAVSAARHFRATLAIDPRNAGALAGLLAVNRTNAGSMEAELKSLVAKHPSSAALHFSLGNQFASERRWVEAQQSFFEAYRLESERPDHAYNLAVSLDHLGKFQLAQEYYSKVLAMPGGASVQFDRASVMRRLRELAAAAAER